MQRPPIEPPPAFMTWRRIDALVGTRITESLVARPANADECRDAIAFARRNGLSVCLRGIGHSYGDAALNDGQMVLSVTGMNRIVSFEPEAGRIVVEPGTRMIDIYAAVHGRGFALEATPTEPTITVAGAIAANVNGKDGWRAGQFGDQVVAFKLLLANGETLVVDRERHGDVFRAVIGGMGILGIVVEATLRLRRVPSPFVATRDIPARNLDELLDELAGAEATSDFIVGWMDVHASGEHLGRSVIRASRWITRSEHVAVHAGRGAPSSPASPNVDATAGANEAEVARGIERLVSRSRQVLAVHRMFVPVMSTMLQVQRPLMALFNRVYFASRRRRGRNAAVGTDELFLKYNFDTCFTVPPAAQLCGPRGFTLQVSCDRAIARTAIAELLETCQRSPCPPVTTILRAHRRDDHLLSFNEDGYSLNFEFHPKRRHAAAMRRTLDALIECTIRHGGKVHLAKEMFLAPQQFRRIFPAHGAFLEIKRRLDPEELFQSEMYRRLFACEAPDARKAHETVPARRADRR